MTTKRPSSSSPEVLRAAAEALWPRVRQWLLGEGETAEQTDGDRESIIEGVARAARFEDDGFEIAVNLQRDGWSPNAGLVEVLEGLAMCKHEALRTAEKAWVSACNVLPAFEVGARVRAHGIEGEVTRIDREHGYYTVFSEALGHVRQGPGRYGRLLKFEEVSAA